MGKKSKEQPKVNAVPDMTGKTIESTSWEETYPALLKAYANLPAAVRDAKMTVAYNRMHGILSTADQLKAARTSESLPEWNTGTVGAGYSCMGGVYVSDR